MDDFESIKIEIPEDLQITLIEPDDDECEHQFEIIQDDTVGLGSVEKAGLDIKTIDKPVKTKNFDYCEDLLMIKDGSDVDKSHPTGRKRQTMSSKHPKDSNDFDTETHKEPTQKFQKKYKTPRKTSPKHPETTVPNHQQQSSTGSSEDTNIQSTSPATLRAYDNITNKLQTPKIDKTQKELNRLMIHGLTSNYFIGFDQLPKERESRRKAITTSKLMTDIVNQNEEVDIYGRIKSTKSEGSLKSVSMSGASSSKSVSTVTEPSRVLLKPSKFDINSTTSGRTEKLSEHFGDHSGSLDQFAQCPMNQASNLIDSQQDLGSLKDSTRNSTFQTDLSCTKNHIQNIHKKISSSSATKTTDSLHECQFCGSAMTMQAIKNHAKRKEKYGVCVKNVCPLCHDPLIKRTLDEHMKEQHPTVRNCCRFCNKKYEVWESCQHHMKYSHASQYIGWWKGLKKKVEERFGKGGQDAGNQNHFFG